MNFRNLTEEDWQLFLQWATQEDWRVSFQEQRLFQNQWGPYFFALQTGGEVCGFVSAVAYRESGWIGNLLVGDEQRGHGYGSALFDFALQFLRQSQPKRVWLTASPSGQPIYERRGFEVIDRVERWKASGAGKHPGPEIADVGALVDLDTACWGESRSPLINALSDDGCIVSEGCTVGLLQKSVSAWQLGPWLSPERDVRENRQLLNEALAKTPHGKELLVDVLCSSELEMVLRSSGFEKAGSNQLMVLSEKPVRLNGVMALASLGSVG